MGVFGFFVVGFSAVSFLDRKGLNMSYTVGGLELSAPIMIGAGVCKTPSVTKEWLPVVPVVSGSYTPQPRSGNAGKVFYPDTWEEVERLGFGLNSFGMPNMGFDAGARDFRSYTGGERLIVSIAGFAPHEYRDGVRAFADLNSVWALELNFGCPNTEHNCIFAFDRASMQETLELVAGETEQPVWVKLSPYTNPGELREVAGLIAEYSHVVKAVVTSNTFPNGFVQGATEPANGYAGVSGPVLRSFVPGQIRQFREHLPDEIDVIGVGGVSTGNHVVEYLNAGAAGVQIVSKAFWGENRRTFWEDLLSEETGGELRRLLNLEGESA